MHGMHAVLALHQKSAGTNNCCMRCGEPDVIATCYLVRKQATSVLPGCTPFLS